MAKPRICIAYDCIYPWTIGGAERWLTGVAQHAAAEGFDVTYLTRLQWDEDAPPAIDGVRVIAVSPRDELYRPDGTRTLSEPVRFGRGIHAHLRRHHAAYDLVHVHAFPFFGALAAGLALRKTGIPLVVDWVEVWTKDYWKDYAGLVAGTAGWTLQARTARMRQHALISSALHQRRLQALQVNGPVTRVGGLYDGVIEPRPRAAATPPNVVFAGRHIPEKNVLAIPAAIAEARTRVPGLTATIFGDGPDSAALRRCVADLGLRDVIALPGFRARPDVDAAIGEAACLLLPSTREGYGIVVVEAAAKGTPAVVVDGPDNAAVELVESGQTGYVAPSTAPRDLADAIVRCVEEGDALRASTCTWANDHRTTLTIEAAMRQVVEVYESLVAPGRTGMPSRRT